MEYFDVATSAVERAAADAYSLCNDPNWEELGEIEDCFCSRKQTDSGIFMTKSVGVIRKSPQEIRDLLWTYNRKKEWDESLDHIYVVHQFSDDFRILYQRFTAPWPVSYRDFVFATKYMDTPEGILLIGQSVNAGVAEVQGVVRGEVLTSAYFLKKLNDTNTEVTYMAGVDPKGSIPTFVVNAVGKKQCLIVSKLRNVIGG
ncbi:hypothetical protein SteCoe_17602 [Stentor coeruleus]|uniref:START domain-containing protein n=1 Tax=Stentor coeruleus TaxID=5963 RepID=A0A1R2BYM1_9CILI|nr:hypothetical protein SteCoe_17602 [Stentor coeruleus]